MTTITATAVQKSVSSSWRAGVLIAMIAGFSVLIGMTVSACKFAPPIPDTIVDVRGATLFTGSDIRAGQAVFLRYGLMENGSIWGHGAYLGPDFSAEYLHTLGLDVAAAVSGQVYGKTPDALTPVQRSAVEAQTASVLKENRYDPATNAVTFTDAEALSFQNQIAKWTTYFSTPANNAGLQAALIDDTQELRQLSAFFAWTSWASVANRLDKPYSYTNNFPYDPLIVALLVLTQGLLGSLVAHYRAAPGSFYGLDLTTLLPSNLVRTWHLQVGLFWIATAYVAGALFLAPAISGKEPKGQSFGVTVLFWALIVVVVGSLLGEWLGVHGQLGNLWFWLGHQGWEFLDLGRFWQILLAAGLVFWLFLLIRAVSSVRACSVS